jgi:hypothetical protein
VESDPARAREVLLPLLRERHAAAGALASDRARSRRARAARTERLACDFASSTVIWETDFRGTETRGPAPDKGDLHGKAELVAPRACVSRLGAPAAGNGGAKTAPGATLSCRTGRRRRRSTCGMVVQAKRSWVVQRGGRMREPDGSNEPVWRNTLCSRRSL